MKFKKLLSILKKELIVSSETIIAITFKLVNFVIVIVGSGVVFQRYFASVVYENKERKELHIVQLQEQAVTLRREQCIIDERIVLDKEYAEALTKKIEKWRNCVKARYHEKTKKNEFIQESIEQKRDIQRKRIQQQWLYKQVVLFALKEAKNQLKKEYATKEQQEQFMSAIIQTIKRR